MKRRQRRRLAFFPLYSMSDLAFLLLIFIMLISLINYRAAITIDYAQGQTAQKVDAGKNLEIWINRSGDLYVKGVTRDPSVIAQHIEQALLEDADTRVHIIADRDTPFENVQAVLSILQTQEHHLVSFVVKND